MSLKVKVKPRQPSEGSILGLVLFSNLCQSIIMSVLKVMSNWGTTSQHSQRQGCCFRGIHSGRNNRQTKTWRNSTRLHTKPCTWEGKGPSNSTNWNLTTCKAAILERTWGVITDWARHEPAVSSGSRNTCSKLWEVIIYLYSSLPNHLHDTVSGFPLPSSPQ